MKKKVISMMLALTLVLSEIPAYTSYAGEISDGNAEVMENNEAETTEKAEVAETETTKAAEEKQNHVFFDFNVAGNGKAVGSDGVLYDDVIYLSADTVNALDEGIQNVYFEVCDSIAELKAQEDALNGAVIAVDEDGNLHYSISVPTLKLAEGAFFSETLKETQEAEVTEETISSEELADNTVTEAESSENASSAEEAAAETTVTEEVSGETTTAEQTTEAEEMDTASTEETSAEETSAETTSSGEVSIEETETEETITESEISAETEAEEEIAETNEIVSTEIDTEEYTFSAENMDLLEYGEEETFEVVKNVNVKPLVDLGYGSGFSQFHSTLASNTYFRDQLDTVEKKIYDAGMAELINGGKNLFVFEYPYGSIKTDHQAGKVHKRAFQAVSAIIMQHPYEMDWMDLSPDGETYINVGVISQGGKDYYSGKFQFVTDVSPYYMASLVNQANAQVSRLATEAQKYALENYPNDIVYGIVKYFDDWVCRNNYYDMTGVGDEKHPYDEYTPAEKEAYFYCHSSYGILLKGYGVCESYALAMTRLLDALGIPNMYATGDTPGGGHAWNYVAMPDGNWYLQDSTWNDDTDPQHVESEGDYLLCADDGYHRPTGARWVLNNGAFKFVDVNKENYNASKGSILNITECDLKVKETAQLDISTYYGKIYASSITSSNPKVAKVDKNGKITAVSGGQAEITVTYSLPNIQLSDTCIVNVYQVKNLISERTKKANDTISLGIKDGSGNAGHITLTADCGDGIDVETMISKAYIDKPAVVAPAKNNIADINVSGIEGNSINLEIQPKSGASGTASYKITVGGKSVTLKVSAGETIDRNYFEIAADYIGGATPYTGKAMKPKVTKKADAPKDLKFKTTYYNNKDAGTASIVVSGTGKYAGEETFVFDITPLGFTESTVTSTIKASSIVYNGGVNQAKATIKYAEGKTKLSLKAGVDYDIIYQSPDGGETSTPQDAGTYKVVAIEGRGNFIGRYDIAGGSTYEIKPISDKKVKVNFTPAYDVVVKIGKNEIPKSDYIVTYYEDKKCEKALSNRPALKGTYYVKVQAGDTGNLTSDGGKTATLKIK